MFNLASSPCSVRVRAIVGILPSCISMSLENTDRPYRPAGTVIVVYMLWSTKPSISFWSISRLLPDKNNDNTETMFLILSFTCFSPALPEPCPKLWLLA